MDNEQIKKYIKVIMELSERIKIEEAKLADYIITKLNIAVEHEQDLQKDF